MHVRRVRHEKVLDRVNFFVRVVESRHHRRAHGNCWLRENLHEFEKVVDDQLVWYPGETSMLIAVKMFDIEKDSITVLGNHFQICPRRKATGFDRRVDGFRRKRRETRGRSQGV